MKSSKWYLALKDLIDSDEFQTFYQSILEDYDKFDVFPPKDQIFSAFKITDFDDVKVVILGQDPYHDYGQANGLAFSVNSGVKLPPSLRNIFKEIYEDLGVENKDGDLTSWANQGVLLLNTSLTVIAHQPRSYANTYWNYFTDEVIKRISKKGNIIFLLWGNDAKKKAKLIEDGNFILTTSHPSPLSVYRGFSGSRIFSETNRILQSIGKEVITWKN